MPAAVRALARPAHQSSVAWRSAGRSYMGKLATDMTLVLRKRPGGER
jgi:hypothetical protein